MYFIAQAQVVFFCLFLHNMESVHVSLSFFVPSPVHDSLYFGPLLIQVSFTFTGTWWNAFIGECHVLTTSNHSTPSSEPEQELWLLSFSLVAISAGSAPPLCFTSTVISKCSILDKSSPSMVLSPNDRVALWVLLWMTDWKEGRLIYKVCFLDIRQFYLSVA